MMRAEGFDPHFFVEQGKKRHAEIVAGATAPENIIVGDQTIGAMAPVIGDLAKFGHGRAWDAQRLVTKSNGVPIFNEKYRDYATVSIGLYAASVGLTLDQILLVEETYGKLFSHWSKMETVDKNYGIPERNVKNTILGYEMFLNKRIR